MELSGLSLSGVSHGFECSFVFHLQFSISDVEKVTELIRDIKNAAEVD